MKALLLLAVLLLSACDDAHTLTACHGSFAPANPGKWEPTAQDLQP